MECTIQARLAVYFEESFWVGVYERIEGGKLSAAKVTFGSEPKDYEVWAYFLRHYSVLWFSPAVEAAVPKTVGNPKRRQRAAAKLVRQDGIVLQGHTHTYHAKQLAQHAAMELGSLPILANDIEVQ